MCSSKGPPHGSVSATDRTGNTNEDNCCFGAARGKTYSVNFPLRDGIDDKSYQAVFKPIMQEIMDRCRALPTLPRGSQPNLFSAVAGGGEATGVVCGLTTALAFAHLGLRCPTSIGLHGMVGRSQVPAGRDRAAVRRRLALRRPARLFQPLPQGPRWVRPWQCPAVPVGALHCSPRRRRADQPTPAAARHSLKISHGTARQ